MVGDPGQQQQRQAERQQHDDLQEDGAQAGDGTVSYGAQQSRMGSSAPAGGMNVQEGSSTVTAVHLLLYGNIFNLLHTCTCG